MRLHRALILLDDGVDVLGRHVERSGVSEVAEDVARFVRKLVPEELGFGAMDLGAGDLAAEQDFRACVSVFYDVAHSPSFFSKNASATAGAYPKISTTALPGLGGN